MSWTHSYSTTATTSDLDERLDAARAAFLDAKRALEEAHIELLRAHGHAVRQSVIED
ncbi:hypothetical protein [Microbacterium sp. SS28]|uniref:hypothetical protein n=1 Tax=Microbacterium sp. SS28 TaxID=2919948 RepID=UPI001FAAB821|nr:hypothetical protein [Microbacterium sp. SS28]